MDSLSALKLTWDWIRHSTLNNYSWLQVPASARSLQYIASVILSERQFVTSQEFVSFYGQSRNSCCFRKFFQNAICPYPSSSSGFPFTLCMSSTYCNSQFEDRNYPRQTENQLVVTAAVCSAFGWLYVQTAREFASPYLLFERRCNPCALVSPINLERTLSNLWEWVG